MPDSAHQTTLPLPDPSATTRLAEALAPLVGRGDCLCLQGALGAGKSHLARALIQGLQRPHGPVEDVPSPSYTLVQTYEAGELTILHADLYRLGDVSEVEELGLLDAMADALCLIEWPDRLGADVPQDALWITLEDARPGRRATLRGAGWADRLARLEWPRG